MLPLIIIASTLIVFFSMTFLWNKNKLLYLGVSGIALVFLIGSQLIHFNENQAMTLVLLIVLFANFYRNHRKATQQ
ncbi:MAG: hypothetical protein ACEQR5_00590 [Moraxellaceae bacterium]|jgi:hypothetical protein